MKLIIKIIIIVAITLLILGMVSIPAFSAEPTVISGVTLDNTSPANLVQNGSFEDDACDKLGYYYINSNSSLNPLGSVHNWSSVNGAVSTYALLDCTNSRNAGGTWDGNNTVYLGSGKGGSMTADIGLPDSNGQLHFSNSTDTMQSSDPASYNVQGNGITQSIPTVVGATYRMSFWASGENADSGVYKAPGIFGLEITGYDQTYWLAPNVGDHVYTIEFVATASSTAITFNNWGHISFWPSMDLSQGSSEIIFDNVIVNWYKDPIVTTTTTTSPSTTTTTSSTTSTSVKTSVKGKTLPTTGTRIGSEFFVALGVIIFGIALVKTTKKKKIVDKTK